MQIAGQSCKVCSRNIGFAADGKFCPRCGAVVHIACETRPACAVCSEIYRDNEPLDEDPLRGALLEPSNRTNLGFEGSLFIFVGAVMTVALGWLLYLVSKAHEF